MDGAADVAETTYSPSRTEPGAAPVRLIVRRVRPTPGSQLALFASYSYHTFITDREGDVLELEADHRRHAEIENAIRDMKYGLGLNHLPSGRFAANASWLAVQVMAHNLARWTARIALGEPVATIKTLRRRFFSLAALNLLAAIVIYWNTAHLGEAVVQRIHAGLMVEPELLAHISPLGWAHIVLTGEYRWPQAPIATLAYDSAPSGIDPKWQSAYTTLWRLLPQESSQFPRCYAALL